MRVALVHTPCPVLLEGSTPWTPVRTNQWPWSSFVLANALRSHGFEVEVLDLRSIANPNDWQSEVGGEYMPPLHYDDRVFTRHLIGDFESKIAACSANVFVVTANFTAEANAVVTTIQAIKRHHPRALVLVGGSDASPPERHTFYLRAGADYVGTGDGDTSLPNFLRQEKRSLQPVFPGGIEPNYSPVRPTFKITGLNYSRYTESGGGPIHPGVFHHGGFAAYTETSRGCARECDFCSDAKSERWKLSVHDLISHLDRYINHGCRLLMISDANLLLNRNPGELRRIFEFLRHRQVAWEFPVGLEVGLLETKQGDLKEEIISDLFWSNRNPSRYAGAHRLLFPVEDALLTRSSLSKLKQVQGRIMRLITRLADTGLPYLNLGIMIGGPHETPDERQNLVRNLDEIHQLVQGLPTRVNFSVFCTSPLPGTDFGRRMTAEGRLARSIEDAPELWTVYGSVLNGDHFSAEATTRFRAELLRRYGMSQVGGKVRPPGT